MRLFLAIDLPDTAKENLYTQLKPFKKDYEYLTWVDPKNFHITVHFFGEVDDPQPIIKTLEEIVFDVDAFRMYALEGDVFISDRITLYIGFQREKQLNYLVQKIQEKYGSDRKIFVPHMTIARYKKPSKQQYFLIKKKMNQLELDIEFPVEKIYLFQSILAGPTPVYKKIAEFPLVTETY